jgi:hypothetical protein
LVVAEAEVAKAERLCSTPFQLLVAEVVRAGELQDALVVLVLVRAVITVLREVPELLIRDITVAPELVVLLELVVAEAVLEKPVTPMVLVMVVMVLRLPLRDHLLPVQEVALQAVQVVLVAVGTVALAAVLTLEVVAATVVLALLVLATADQAQLFYVFLLHLR